MVPDALIGYFAELGLETVKDKIKTKTDQVIIKNKIAEFIEFKRKENFSCTREEEIDFGGLAHYLSTYLLDDVKIRLTGTRKERAAAHEHIMAMTAQYAAAKTQLSQKRAQKIVTQALEILKKYHRSGINQDLKLIAAEIEDCVEEMHQESLEGIKRLERKVGQSAVLSLDNNLQLAKSGKIDTVQENLTVFMDALNSTHLLKPYYGYEFCEGNMLRSIPLTSESVELYPPRIDIKASEIRLGDIPITKIEENIFKQSYYHQIPIYFNVVAAKKYLGVYEDPAQAEAIDMIGTHAVVKPPEFPPAFPCSVSVGTDIIIDYLLLRTKEIMDDGAVVITNEEQRDYSFHVRMSLNFATKKMTFNVRPNNPTNRQALKYRQFLQRVNAGEIVTVKVLTLNEPLISGTVDHREIDNLDVEIDFFQKIVVIEDYFKEQITIPEEIKHEDLIIINRLYELIKGSYRGSWEDYEFTFILTEETKLRVLELTDQACDLFYTGECAIEIFENKFTLPIIRKISNATVRDLEKTKIKANVLDIGDELKVHYIPKEGKGEYIDQILSEEVKQGILLSSEREKTGS